MSILDDEKLWDKVFPGSKATGPRKTYPPFWTPKVGDAITGQIVKITTSGKTGKNYYQIATESESGEDGRLLTLPAVTAVYSAIGSANEEYDGDVGVGSIVYIKYHGRKVSKKGFEYRNFETFISPREVAKKIMEGKGLVDEDGKMLGWRGVINDDDVKVAEAAREEWMKSQGKKSEEKKEEGDEKPKPKKEKKKPKKAKKEEKQEELDTDEARIQSAKDEIEKMCVAFPRFPVATVENILKSTQVDMDAEMFLQGMGIKVEDGNALRPE